MIFSLKSGRLCADNLNVEYVPSPYTGSRFASGHPKILVMHFTYGGTARSSAEWFRSAENRPGSSAHIVIERDGAVVQCVPVDTVAWHAGKSQLISRSGTQLAGLNNYSIGIELANWGYLQKTASGWTAWTGTKVSEPILAMHKNGNPDGSRCEIGWEPYPVAQFNTAVQVAKLLVSEYGIEEIVGHDDIAPTRKWDPGPAFDFNKFRSQVFSSRNLNSSGQYFVWVESGLNLRKGPGISYDSAMLLARGTNVSAIDQDGRWLLVSVVDENGSATATGWVHSAYLSD